MRVLIACEESQTVCKAFRKLGHEAYSCDIQDCSGGHPEWHIKGDAIEEAYSGKYDLMIAHPPCTYLSNAGAAHLYKGKTLNKERYEKGLEWKDFFLKLLNAHIEKIAIENPVSSSVFEMPECSQEIQPHQFGHAVTKKTRLWLKNLPPLMTTDNVIPCESCHDAHTWFSKGGKDRQRNRAKTFKGIADAMALQWGGDITDCNK